MGAEHHPISNYHSTAPPMPPAAVVSSMQSQSFQPGFSSSPVPWAGPPVGIQTTTGTAGRVGGPPTTNQKTVI